MCPTRTLSPKTTHQAGRVPTWSLYKTNGVAPLCLAPFLGYTGVIPLLNHSQNDTPYPDFCTHSLPKNEFSQDTHIACRVPTLPVYNTHGVAPMCLAPVSGNEAQRHVPKTPILGPTRTISPKVSLKKRVFPGYPPGRSSTYMAPSIISMGLHPCAWPVLRLHCGHTLA